MAVSYFIIITQLHKKLFNYPYLNFVHILVKGIFRQALHEMPLLTYCTPFAIVGLALISYHTYRYVNADGNNRKYKQKYTRKCYNQLYI